MNTLTAEDAAVYIRWNPGNYGPSTIQLDWAPANLFPGLPSSVTKSDTGAPYTFHRQQTIDQDVIARIKINGQIISGANIVIPAIVPKTVFTYSCAKLSATHDQCLRCDFEVTKLPPSVSWETHACNHMPVATPVSASFKGRVTQSKLPGQTCELVANFRGPDGKETTGINPAYQQSPEASCSWDVSFGPTDFKGATTDKTGLVEAADQLGSCMPPTYANCTMSGTLSIFVPDGADSN
jgi:hypothetical protein